MKNLLQSPFLFLSVFLFLNCLNAQNGSIVSTCDIATVIVDGNLDATGYYHITENPFAAPIPGGGPNSDFIGEGSACHVAYEANTFTDNWDNICNQGWGTADIQQFHVSWDADYLYLLVEGPSAYGDGGTIPDRMDLFIAIDTDNNTTPGTTFNSTWVYDNKRVDFAGWDPEYFVKFENENYGQMINSIGSAAVNDIDNTVPTATGSFETVINRANATSEVRIPWINLGGAPPSSTGKHMNFAVFTTFDLDDFDLFDSGPGVGNNGPFEQVGDSPWDADHCNGATDPVSGLGDAPCGYTESDDTLGPGANLGNYVQPGSDNAQLNGADEADYDTIEEYYAIQNIGKSCSCPAILSCDNDFDGDGLSNTQEGCFTLGLNDLYEYLDRQGILQQNASGVSLPTTDISVLFGLPPASVFVRAVNYNTDGNIFSVPDGLLPGTNWRIFGTAVNDGLIYGGISHHRSIYDSGPQNPRDGFEALDGTNYSICSALDQGFQHINNSSGSTGNQDVYYVRNTTDIPGQLDNSSHFHWYSNEPLTQVPGGSFNLRVFSFRTGQASTSPSQRYWLRLRYCRDTDADGVVDAVDLDSDNDGICDAVELGADLDDDSYSNNIDLDSDGDGCLDSDESGNAGLIGVNVWGDPSLVDACGRLLDGNTTASSGYCNEVGSGDEILPCVIACVYEDKDNDNVPDHLDLDIDNDGILNTQECQPRLNDGTLLETSLSGLITDTTIWNPVIRQLPANQYTLEDFEAFNQNDKINDLTFAAGMTIKTTNDLESVVGDYDIDGVEFNSEPLSGNNQVTISQSLESETSSTVIRFPKPVVGFGMNFGDLLDVNNLASIKITFGNTLVWNSSGSIGVFTTGTLTNMVNGEMMTGGNNVWHFVGFYDPENPISSVTIEKTAAATQDRYAMDDITIILPYCDADGDGIVNEADLDSDNDGVPDAIEACGDISLALEDCRLDNNGDGVYEINPETGCSSGVLSVICLPPSGLSNSDMDDLPDFIDLDSDNDGCSDNFETGTEMLGTSGASYSNGPVDSCGLLISGVSGSCPIPTTTIWIDKCLQIGCPDLDNDLVMDAIDVDDDNDGIPDLADCPDNFEPGVFTLGSNNANGNEDGDLTLPSGDIGQWRLTSSFPNTDGSYVNGGITNTNDIFFQYTGDSDWDLQVNFSLNYADTENRIVQMAFFGNTETALAYGSRFSSYTISWSGGYGNAVMYDSTDQTSLSDGAFLNNGGTFTQEDCSTWSTNISLECEGAGMAGIRNNLLEWSVVFPVGATDFTINATGGANAEGFRFAVLERICDLDGDGIYNHEDLDSDNDGIPDAIEACSDLTLTLEGCMLDNDGNGVYELDPVTGCSTGLLVSACAGAPVDSDPAGFPDFLSLDSDEDNCPDNVEAGTAGLGTSYDVYVAGSVDAFGLLTTGVSGACQVPANDNWVNAASSFTCDIDDDNDGIPDVVELCGVGATDFSCLPGGSDPHADDDDDGVLNYNDPDYCTLNTEGVCEDMDTDSDGIPNHLDLDSDNDGITDVIEGGGLDPDGDGVVGTGTPLDSDRDGLPDDADPDGTNSVNTGTPGDTNLPIHESDTDGIPDFLDLDSDNDGINDIIEGGGIDTDGNAMVDDPADQATITNPTDTDNDGIPDYREIDSDNDGVTDISQTTLAGFDVNGDGMIDNMVDIDEDGIMEVADGIPTVFGDAPRGTKLAIRLLLEGPYIAATGLMRDHLNVNGLIPTLEPYTALGYQHSPGRGGETVDPAVFNISGNDAIVDWVFVELRNAVDFTQIIATRTALLQADGDVVDVDGMSSVYFADVPTASYYIVARHRNHLDVMTPGALPLNEVFANLHDFTTGSAYGVLTFPDVQQTLGPAIFGLFACDFNNSASIDAGDRSIAWNFRNQTGYRVQDATFDGVCDAVERSLTWNNRNKLSRVP